MLFPFIDTNDLVFGGMDYNLQEVTNELGVLVMNLFQLVWKLVQSEINSYKMFFK